MAPAAVRRRRLLAEQRFHSCFGMAARTNHVIPESGIRTVRLEMMAEGAICAVSRTRVDPSMRIRVLRVRKLVHDRPLVFVTRVGQQILAAGRRKHRMALLADLLL